MGKKLSRDMRPCGEVKKCELKIDFWYIVYVYYIKAR